MIPNPYPESYGKPADPCPVCGHGGYYPGCSAPARLACACEIDEITRDVQELLEEGRRRWEALQDPED